MTTVTVTKENFEEVSTGNDIVLVDFWAGWCGPCRAFAPVFEQAAEENPDLVFAKVDTEAEHGLASAFEIMSIPTLMALRDSAIVCSRPGALPAEALGELIESVRALDMEDVHRRVAEAQTTHGS